MPARRQNKKKPGAIEAQMMTFSMQIHDGMRLSDLHGFVEDHDGDPKTALFSIECLSHDEAEVQLYIERLETTAEVQARLERGREIAKAIKEEAIKGKKRRADEELREYKRLSKIYGSVAK